MQHGDQDNRDMVSFPSVETDGKLVGYSYAGLKIEENISLLPCTDHIHIIKIIRLN